MELSKEFLYKIINITSKAAIACYPHLGKEDKIQDLLQYFMGKNTKERQSFIIDNLRIEEEFLPHN